MKKFILVFSLSFVLFSCSPTLKVKQLNPETGKLPTETIITQD